MIHIARSLDPCCCAIAGLSRIVIPDIPHHVELRITATGAYFAISTPLLLGVSFVSAFDFAKRFLRVMPS
jgi:hypothetical protein